jgi:hypothetical protein
LRAYGELVYAEAQPTDTLTEPTEARQAMQALQNAVDEASDLLLVNPRDDSALALLTASLLATVERVLQELSLDQRARLHERRVQTLPQRLAARSRDSQRDLAKKMTRRRRRHP